MRINCDDVQIIICLLSSVVGALIVGPIAFALGRRSIVKGRWWWK